MEARTGYLAGIYSEIYFNDQFLTIVRYIKKAFSHGMHLIPLFAILKAL